MCVYIYIYIYELEPARFPCVARPMRYPFIYLCLFEYFRVNHQDLISNSGLPKLT